MNGCSLLFASNLRFTRNTVYGNASESTGTLNDGCLFSGTDLLIEDNLLHDGWAYDGHPDGLAIQGDGDRNGNDTANVVVNGNRIYNFSQGLFIVAVHKTMGSPTSQRLLPWVQGFDQRLRRGKGTSTRRDDCPIISKGAYPCRV